MLTLSYGFQKPQTNDRGNIVFPALEQNFQQLNDHDHNGVNSKPINSSFLEKTNVSVPAINWALVAGGHYTQTVTLPLALEYDKVILTFRLTDGTQVHPTVKKASLTQFTVDFDDPSQTLVCLIN
jgi:hypothetical protein